MTARTAAGVRRMIRNRIVRHDAVPPDQLLADPWNYRRHAAAQRAALHGSLCELGWTRSVLVNGTTGHVLDGHTRIAEALNAREPVPVEYVLLTDEEEAVALAVLDPVTGMTRMTAPRRRVTRRRA